MAGRGESNEIPPAGVVVPVKAFSEAKARLAAVLDPEERRALARRMAETVLAAAHDLPAVVVCDDDAVRQWASSTGAEALWTPGLGLDAAVTAGVEHLADRGVTSVVVAHADLPLARDLRWVAAFGGVTVIPDRHLDGTNVICVPSRSGFTFSYGPRSFERHRAEAARLGLPVRVVPDPELGWDVDVPEDLEALSEVPCR